MPSKDKMKKKLKKEKKLKKKQKEAKRKNTQVKVPQDPPNLAHQPAGISSASSNHVTQEHLLSSSTSPDVIQQVKSIDARDFFKQIAQQESQKSQTGTFHAKGNTSSSVGSMPSTTMGDWECTRRGCGHKNHRLAQQCQQCKAMKRLSEWR